MATLRATLEALQWLQGLAEANAAEMREEPELLADYREALTDDRFLYRRNALTCGQPQCWSTWRGLRDRYGSGTIEADCKQLVGAHAAYLLATTGVPVWVGIRFGRVVAHAVCGVDEGEGRIRLMDPSVVAGMPPLPDYRNVNWIQLRGQRC